MNDLLARLAAAGFQVELTPNGPRLLPTFDGARVPLELLAEVKARRADIIAYLQSGREPSDPEEESCRTCGRVTGAEDRAVLATNHYLCDRWECPHKAAARRQERWAA